MGYVIGVCMLLFLIFIHELGHFLVGLFFKMPIKSFAIGFGPAIFKKVKNGIQYRFNLIPLGGYVSMHGENDDKIENGFMHQPIYKRFWVLIAGIIFNFITAYIIILFLFTFWGTPHQVAQIGTVIPNSNAVHSLKADDIILKINNHDISSQNYMEIPNFIKERNNSADIQIRRDNEILDFSIPLTKLDDKYILGITYGPSTVFYKDGNTVKDFFVKPFQETGELFKTILTNLKMLLTGEVHIKDMQGPVGIVDTTNTIFHISIPLLLWWFALISINLGIMNALPIPALDGGQILFLLLEKIVGKNKWNKRFAAIFNGIFFLILLCFMIFITYGDIVRLFKP